MAAKKKKPKAKVKPKAKLEKRAKVTFDHFNYGVSVVAPLRRERVIGGVKKPPPRVEQSDLMEGQGPGVGPPARPIEVVIDDLTAVASMPVPVPVKYKPNQWEMRSLGIEMPLKDMLDNSAHYLAWVYCSEQGHRVPIKGKEPAYEVPCPACRSAGVEIVHEALVQLRARGMRT